MQVVAGQTFTATLVTNGAVAGLGARIEQPVTRAILDAWEAAVRDADTGVWSVTLDAPGAAGEYQLVWRTMDGEPPAYEYFVPLTTVLVAPVTGDDPDAWKPTLADIARVTPAYTRGGFDDDDVQAGAEQATFTTTTSPNAAHVTALIDLACAEVMGRVGVEIPGRLHGLAKATATWHVAAAISSGKMPAGTDDAAGEYRSYISNYRASLDELARQARAVGVRLT